MFRKGMAFSALFAALLMFSFNSQAFTCVALGQQSITTSGSMNVFVNLTPVIQENQNLAVSLGESIKCRNDDPEIYNDPVRLGYASSYVGVLAGFKGSVSYYGDSYPFPLLTPTKSKDTENYRLEGWDVNLYLQPILDDKLNAAKGVFIRKGWLFARLRLEKLDTTRTYVVQTIIWNLYANNDVTIPVAGCDVSARNVAVSLPDYPEGPAPVDLSVHCSAPFELGYFLSGTTTDSGATVFQNTASSPAQGVGIQMRSQSAGILKTNQTVPLGTVSSTPVDLGLSAQYTRTGQKLTAGNVQSVIGVTFVYP